MDGGGGWAFAAVCDNVIISEGSGHVEDTTNNRMELSAIIEAMRWMVVNDYSGLTIWTDSQYSQGVIAYGHAAKKNEDLIDEGRQLFEQCHPTISWVKGHAGNRWNEHVDKLAGDARKRPQNQFIRSGAVIPPARRPKGLYRLLKGG